MVEGLPPGSFFRVWALAEKRTAVMLDLKPLETASDTFRTAVCERGVAL